jgi:heme-degrading monooxygenase HmoA
LVLASSDVLFPSPTIAVVILEVAILNIRTGESEAFEAAFLEAQKILAASSGHQRHELRKCVEAGDRYLLLVWWDSLESHTRGFRQSPGYQRWRGLLHRFYEPFPTVEHYVAVPGASA